LLKIAIDDAAKNSFSPQMTAQMSDALTLPQNTDEYWVGMVFRAGESIAIVRAQIPNSK
jgi:enoyl-CoA hydratase